MINWLFRILFFSLFNTFFKRLSVLFNWQATSQLSKYVIYLRCDKDMDSN